MLRAQYSLVALGLALFAVGCTPAGCAGEDPEQDKASAEQFANAVELKLPAPAPGTPSLYGSWSGPKMAGHIDLLVLMTDGSFHTSQSVTCAKAPCDPVVSDGTFKLFTRGERTYFELTGRDVQRYEYALTNENMRIRPLVPGSEWFALDRAGIGWCSGDRQCGYQNLPPGICAGGYKCENSGCAWKCVRNDPPTESAPTDGTKGVNPGDSKAP